MQTLALSSVISYTLIFQECFFDHLPQEGLCVTLLLRALRFHGALGVFTFSASLSLLCWLASLLTALTPGLSSPPGIWEVLNQPLKHDATLELEFLTLWARYYGLAPVSLGLLILLPL